MCFVDWFLVTAKPIQTEGTSMSKQKSKKPTAKPAPPKQPLGVLVDPQYPGQQAIRIGKREPKEKK
jgi:hypothetical protein